MTTVTVGKLIDLGLDRADMVNSRFSSNDVLLDYATDSFAEYYDLIVTCYEDDFAVFPAPEFSVPSQAFGYPLPTDFYKLRGLDKKESGDWVEVSKFQLLNRNRNQVNRPIQRIYPRVRYRIYGNQIIFDDTDNSDGDYRIFYIPKPPTFTDRAETVTFDSATRKELVVNYIAEKLLIKEESDTTAVAFRIANLRKTIVDSAIDRDPGEPDQITDITSDSNNGLLYNGFDAF